MPTEAGHRHSIGCADLGEEEVVGENCEVAVFLRRRQICYTQARPRLQFIPINEHIPDSNSDMEVGSGNRGQRLTERRFRQRTYGFDCLIETDCLS
ncbi:hypothetical protein BELL_0517g00070 [Botrytis elliptica]|uniref:Uncharacterized protein n=1 Tax=Botrytis elliptica TaxID=278938 RepID=A0A4Z1JK93_9HELO|nr:hypothetical protein BELL_0517g00070 [Botrytis elliptica]